MFRTLVVSCNAIGGIKPPSAPDSSTAAVSTLTQKILDRVIFLDTLASLTSASNGAAFLHIFHAVHIRTVSDYHLLGWRGSVGQEVMTEP